MPAAVGCQQFRRCLTTSLGVYWPWTVNLRYAVTGAIRRMLKRPAEQDFRIIKFLNAERGDVFCDIGCNRGQSIQNFLMFNGGFRIVAFEPNPVVCSKRIAKFGHRPNVTIHNVGLGADYARKTLYMPKYRKTSFDELASFDKASALHWFSRNHVIGLNSKLISLTEFDCEITVLDDYQLPVAMIKIDAQGYEEQVLRGAAATLRTWKPIVLAENDELSSAEAVSNMLGELGYRPYRFDGRTLHPKEFGVPNTFYIAPGFERGLERLITKAGRSPA
jgi:FkbM family methyltransferase